MIGAGLSESLTDLYIEFSKSINSGALIEDFHPSTNSVTSTSIEEFAKEFAIAFQNS
jgi:hypothetical protein